MRGLRTGFRRDGMRWDERVRRIVASEHARPKPERPNPSISTSSSSCSIFGDAFKFMHLTDLQDPHQPYLQSFLPAVLFRFLAVLAFALFNLDYGSLTFLSPIAQRPCSRCLSNGKEDACVDVQHKKRGRPRLRDEREPRYDGMVAPSYGPPESLRRPLSLYGPETAMAAPFGDPLHRTSSYRVLKSQGGGMGGPIAPRYPEHQPPADTNIYGGSLPPTPRMPPSPEPICAYLTMEMQVAKATKVFEETIGVQPVTSRKLHDIVSPADRDKVFRLQRIFEDERRVREPNYLPPIYLKYEEDRVIQSVGFGPEEVNQFRLDRSEMITFQALDGQQRTFQIRFGLAKKESTYFVIVVISVPTTPQTFHQPTSSPYSRDAYPRDPQYGYQPQPVYQSSHPSASFMQNPPFGESQSNVTAYRTPGSLGSTISAPANVSPFAQSSSQRPEYPPSQNQYQPPRSDLPQAQAQGQASMQTQTQAQAQSQRQRDLQLPPIRDQRGDEPSGRRDDRARFDIGGLLENPDTSGRSQ